LFQTLEDKSRRRQYKTRYDIAGSVAYVIFGTMMSTPDNIKDKIWIGHSGASCHYCSSGEGLFDYTTIS
jgi:hypothetical protein